MQYSSAAGKSLAGSNPNFSSSQKFIPTVLGLKLRISSCHYTAATLRVRTVHPVAIAPRLAAATAAATKRCLACTVSVYTYIDLSSIYTFVVANWTY